MTYHLVENARLVGGHPMEYQQKKDQKTGLPKLRKDGSPQMETWFYLAFPKNGHSDWRTHPLGQVMVAEATRAFKANEIAASDFAWKIIDGDSAVPMKGGKPAPNTREGFAGHWVLRVTTGMPVRCFHVGKYGPFDQIQDKNEIKCGDYCSVNLDVQPNNINGAQETNGLYMNPHVFRLDRAGEAILFETGPSAAEVFGGAAAATASPPPPVTAPAPAPVAAPPPPPHNPLPKMYIASNGEKYTREQLQGYGFTVEQIDALPTA